MTEKTGATGKKPPVACEYKPAASSKKKNWFKRFLDWLGEADTGSGIRTGSSCGG